MAIKTVWDSGKALKSSYRIPALPLPLDLESKSLLKKTKEAGVALAELKGVALSVPNRDILINTLSLQEAKDSSAVENIITTQDELYRSDAVLRQFTSAAAKEVHLYADALRNGYLEVKTSGLLTNRHIRAMQATLEGNDAGFRSQSGTVLKNKQTGEVVYIPPQEFAQIEEHMRDLERFINEDDLSDWDALVKMAVIHHQFESIHPFFDGNGRTGRIVNILYLVKQGLLDTPILYLSRYINQHKSEYYRLLQAVRDDGMWVEWTVFMMEGIRQTSYQTIRLIKAIKELMRKHKITMRDELRNIYSQDFLNLIFSHPYTKINHAEEALLITRKTAAKYLEALVTIGLLRKMKLGRENYYVNQDLMTCLSNAHSI